VGRVWVLRSYRLSREEEATLADTPLIPSRPHVRVDTNGHRLLLTGALDGTLHRPATDPGANGASPLRVERTQCACSTRLLDDILNAALPIRTQPNVLYLVT
jgi:hypothetical protein